MNRNGIRVGELLHWDHFVTRYHGLLADLKVPLLSRLPILLLLPLLPLLPILLSTLAGIASLLCILSLRA
jgi:hypothetical protein